MFLNIISLLLDVATGLVAGACLLRLYMQCLRVPMSVRSGNPLGGFLFALTDWIVLPLRKILPVAAISSGRWDLSSLTAAFLLELAQFSALWLLGAFGTASNAGFDRVLVMAVFGLFRLALSGLTGLIIVYAVMSWVQTSSVLSTIMARLCEPLLAPIRRHLPLLGGFDLSPLVVLVLFQIAGILLAGIQTAVLR